MVNRLFQEPTGLAVVNGSIELLTFMARMEDTLTLDHVCQIWRSGLQRGLEFQVWPKSVFYVVKTLGNLYGLLCVVLLLFFPLQ